MGPEWLDDLHLPPSHRLVVRVEDRRPVDPLDVEQRQRIPAEDAVAGASVDAFERTESKRPTRRGTKREPDRAVVPRRSHLARFLHSKLAYRDARGSREPQVTHVARNGPNP